MNKSARLALLTGAFAFSTFVHAQTVPPEISCSSADASLFNTAYDGNGGKLPNGQLDPNWDFGLGNDTDFSSVTTWNDAYVFQLGYAWTSSPWNNASWIAATPNADNAPEWIYYRFRFNLDPTVPPAAFSLPIDYYVDNAVTEIYVNDVAQSAYGAIESGGFYAANVKSRTLNHDWQVGTNEIIIKTWNQPGGPAGLMIQTRPNIVPCAKFSTIPSLSPHATTLLGVVLVSFAYAATRRKST